MLEIPRAKLAIHFVSQSTLNGNVSGERFRSKIIEEAEKQQKAKP